MWLGFRRWLFGFLLFRAVRVCPDLGVRSLLCDHLLDWNDEVLALRQRALDELRAGVGDVGPDDEFAGYDDENGDEASDVYSDEPDGEFAPIEYDPSRHTKH